MEAPAAGFRRESRRLNRPSKQATGALCLQLRFALPVRAASQALCTHFVQQRLGILQIGGVEAFGELVVDFGEHRVGLFELALLREQPREARGRAQLQ